MFAADHQPEASRYGDAVNKLGTHPLDSPMARRPDFPRCAIWSSHGHRPTLPHGASHGSPRRTTCLRISFSRNQAGCMRRGIQGSRPLGRSFPQTCGISRLGGRYEGKATLVIRPLRPVFLQPCGKTRPRGRPRLVLVGMPAILDNMPTLAIEKTRLWMVATQRAAAHGRLTPGGRNRRSQRHPE